MKLATMKKLTDKEVAFLNAMAGNFAFTHELNVISRKSGIAFDKATGVLGGLFSKRLVIFWKTDEGDIIVQVSRLGEEAFQENFPTWAEG